MEILRYVNEVLTVTCMYAYTHIYIHAYIYTYTHTHTERICNTYMYDNFVKYVTVSIANTSYTIIFLFFLFSCSIIFLIILHRTVQHVLNIPKFLSKEAIQKLKLSPEGSSSSTTSFSTSTSTSTLSSTSSSWSSILENTIIEIRGM